MDDFDEFVRGRSAALARVAYLLTGDRHAAEDLLQDLDIRARFRCGHKLVIHFSDYYSW